jgi:undecaprenyl diphosphate synthase|uniref:Isoprenyl transferase n=1 Tax=candidate division WOR-3 bacterium TaxID=2052148 RepID=A0A7C3Z386_UNCW3
MENIPQHIAIIMDGNGRWARKRGLPRVLGHREGVNSVKEVVRTCGEMGIKYLTLFVFSEENWQRPKREIEQLMSLLEEVIKKEREEFNKNDVRVKVIGRLEKLPEGLRNELLSVVRETENNRGLILVLALSYGGRQEIVDAVKKIKGEEIDEERFRSFLYDPTIPDPDLLIRTGGEKRISNFLLYHIAYTELYFTDCLWPDFRKKELLLALEDYARRRRRFGKVEEEIEG